MNILFLSVSAGGGHMRAAECLTEYIRSKDPSWQILTVDTLKYVNPILDKVIVGSYLKALQTTPFLYGKLYELSETGENLNDLSIYINQILSLKIKKLIIDYNPHIIICTHPFPLQMVAPLKKKKILDTPLVGIVTDYTVHSFWVNKYADALIVAGREMKQDMINKGIEAGKVYDFGIPVSRKFADKKPRNQILRQLGLEDKPTVLIMGGSLGFGNIEKVFLSLLDSERDIQLIVVAGKNEKLRKHLEQLGKGQKNVKVLGYTNRIADLMAVSDLIFTKPGGVTVSEALAMHLPMVITSPIPGQEERNASFLLENGVALRIPEDGNAKMVLEELMDNPSLLLDMKKKASLLARPNSCENIYLLLCRLLGYANASGTSDQFTRFDDVQVNDAQA